MFLGPGKAAAERYILYNSFLFEWATNVLFISRSEEDSEDSKFSVTKAVIHFISYDPRSHGY